MITTINTRDWIIKLNGLPIDYMFDASGSETMTPTDAVETATNHGIARLHEGDTLSFVFVGDAT
jgi:hypothetical protein